MMDQLNPFHTPNKKLRSEKVMTTTFLEPNTPHSLVLPLRK
jgi:hypothetical protein